MNIGFVGQGWIGKNYANDFENRDYNVTRYSLEKEYVDNKEKIKDCDVVFIAVPTPTTECGFDSSYVEDALTNIGHGKVAVIKSTILPGTTETLQSKFSNIYVMHSPEFLVEKTAAFDAANPSRNIIGIPVDSSEYKEKAEIVLGVLPNAPYEKIMRARDAELIKYAGNCFLFTKVMYMNLLYDVVESIGGDWEAVREGLVHDSRIGESHTVPVHDGGRGAGGHCFIKDFEAFRRLYAESSGNVRGSNLIEALIDRNIELLVHSRKNMDLLESVYGDLSKYQQSSHDIIDVCKISG